MSQQSENLLQVDIEKELRQSYLEYSLSVIVGRAIPDARDGLKPVHRRIMFSQQDLGNYYNKPHKKSARIVGDVIGKYHPHGDSAVYDALVRMAQDFSMHLPLIDGQGNFGSIDGDPPAAMRYTEVRMSRLAQEFLADLDKNTVDFRPNYDNTLQEPVVLPTRVPNLLLNGSSGIAVGMATNIPPHNLGELCDALLYLLEHPDASIADLMTLIKGPDFPTAGSVYIGKGLFEAYHTGRGTIKMRGRVKIEDRNKHLQSVVITEIPFGVNKSALVEKIATLINERTMEGVSDLRDESDRKGIRIVLDLKRGTLPEIIINTLYKYTPLESSFGINMLAVLDNRPIMLNLKTALSCFIEHRREVIIRRTRFDLQKAEARLHLLDGLKIALEHIEDIIALIRASATPEAAKQALVANFALTDIQAKAVIEMRLQRLTALQREEIQTEYADLTGKIKFFHSVLDDPEILRSEMQREIQEVKTLYALPRRTEIMQENPDDIAIEDIIPDDDVVITLSRRGYIKRVNLENYQQQKRGGKGIAGVNTVENDCIHELLITSNHQYLCLFTNKGLIYLLKVHQIPMGSRTSKGAHINNILPLAEGESVSTIVALRQFDEDNSFLFVTKRGTVKRSAVSLYARGRRTGIIAISLADNDELVMVKTVCEQDQIILATKKGFSIRFACSEVRPMGRATSGMRGILLREEDEVIGAVVCKEADNDLKIMSVSAKGFGKKTNLDCYRLQGRGGKGVLNFRVSYKSGPVIGAMAVRENDGLVMLTSANKIIRISSDEVRSTERATLGVRLVRLDDGAQVLACDRVDESEQTVPEPSKTLLDL